MSCTNEKLITSRRFTYISVNPASTNTGIPNSNDDLPLAKQVCTNCKRRKKGCDKRLPCCSFCKRRRITCNYDYSDGNNTVSELQQIRERLGTVENSIAMQSPPYSKIIDSISPKENSIASWLGSLLDIRSGYPVVPDSQVSNIHGSVARNVRQIIEHNEINITTSCASYFEHVHRWLPIISQKLFYDNLRNAATSPNADFSLLILCIHLMIQVPAGNTEVTKMPESLYLMTKCLYACLQTLLPPSITSLQAGLLIATFEHASGLCEAAYMTIGGCARASALMGLSRTPSRDIPKDANAWLRAVETKNLWWGIFIRDRALNLEPQMQGLPLSVEDPSPFDELPSEVDEWSLSTKQTLSLEGSLSVSTVSKLSVGSFGREAQACCLFNKVVKARHNTSLTNLERENCVRTLDEDLQRFLRLLMHQSSGAWGTFCGSTSMTLASLYILHEQHSALTNEYLSHQNVLSPRSEIALEYITRIVIDVTRCFNMNFSKFNMAAIPPGYTNIIFRAALHHIRSSNQVGTAQWLSDLESLRRSSWLLKHRWKVAEKYLEEIDKTAKAATSSPLCQYTGFVSPQGNKSGLC